MTAGMQTGAISFTSTRKSHRPRQGLLSSGGLGFRIYGSGFRIWGSGFRRPTMHRTKTDYPIMRAEGKGRIFSHRTLGGSCALISRVTSTLNKVIAIITLFKTLLISSHEPPSRAFRQPYNGILQVSAVRPKQPLNLPRALIPKKPQVLAPEFPLSAQESRNKALPWAQHRVPALVGLFREIPFSCMSGILLLFGRGDKLGGEGGRGG